MSRKSLPTNKKKQLTFIEFVEQETKLSQCNIYTNLGWSRQRYRGQKKERFFPMKHLEDLRLSIGYTELNFYSLVRRFLNGVHT
jgi:hypothetical protein